MISRKLPMETLQKLHLSNRLYIEQVTCHLLILLLSARASSEIAKWNSICFEIFFDRSSSLIKTSQLICVANWLIAVFVMRKVRGFCLISGWRTVSADFLIVLLVNQRRQTFFCFFVFFFDGDFLTGGLGEVSVFCAA